MSTRLKINIPYISLNDLIERANKFLQKYHPSRKIPVPIEEIVEFSLKISVLPITRLKKDLDIDSYLSSDFRYLIIDQYCYDNFEERTRFTYAHEVGHLFLHKKIYQSYEIKDITTFKRFQNLLTIEDKKRLEFQAHLFAGYILLPQEQFGKSVSNLVSEAGGINSVSVMDIGKIIQNLANQYLVSTDVIFKQLKYEYQDLFQKIFRS